MFSLLAALAFAPAQPGTVEFDLQCIGASYAVMERLDQGSEMARQVEMAALFFAARADQKLPDDEEFIAKATAMDLTMQDEDISVILQNCGQFMMDRGSRLERLGAEAEKRASEQ